MPDEHAFAWGKNIWKSWNVNDIQDYLFFFFFLLLLHLMYIIYPKWITCKTISEDLKYLRYFFFFLWGSQRLFHFSVSFSVCKVSGEKSSIWVGREKRRCFKNQYQHSLNSTDQTIYRWTSNSIALHREHIKRLFQNFYQWYSF